MPRLEIVDSSPERFPNITGVILAGGGSTRMGADKAFLRLNGKPFIQHIADAMRQLFETVIISGDDKEKFRFLDLPVVPDRRKGCGPLGAIYSALLHSSTDWIFVTACDMPGLTAGVMRTILNQRSERDAILPDSGTGIQPLCGMYSRRCSSVLERHLSSGQYSVMRFLGSITTHIVSLLPGNEAGLASINTPSEYYKLLRDYGMVCDEPAGRE